MGLAPSTHDTATPLIVSTLSSHSVGKKNCLYADSVASRTWVANLVQYVPFYLTTPYSVQRFLWMNGATASSNVDVGIYSAGGTLLASTGSTAQSGASTPQYATPSGGSFVLSPGSYYFAYTCNGTTNRAYTATQATVNVSVWCGLLEETTGGFGLPATMTPVRYTRAFGAQLMGVTRTTTGF